MRVWIPLLLLVGCEPEPGNNKKNQKPGDTDVVDSDTGDPRALCQDAPVLGSSGAFAHQTESFDWTWDNRIGIARGPTFVYQVPDDLSSLLMSVELSAEWVGFALVENNGEVLVDADRRDGSEGGWDSAPHYHYAVEGGSMIFPITGITSLQPGCLTVQPAALDRQTQQATLHLLSRRSEPARPLIDLNIVVVGDAPLFQQDLDEALDRVDEVWGNGDGPGVGDVNMFTVNRNSLVPYRESNELRRMSLGKDAEQAVNVYFIRDYAKPDGTLGEAGGIPGPVGIDGIDGGGLIMSIESHWDRNDVVDTNLMGETLAHEIGHQLGLFHTTEKNGRRTESLEDTPECPASKGKPFYAGKCRDFDGRNFMFWTAGSFPQTEVSAEQAFVLNHSPIAR